MRSERELCEVCEADVTGYGGPLPMPCCGAQRCCDCGEWLDAGDYDEPEPVFPVDGDGDVRCAECHWVAELTPLEWGYLEKVVIGAVPSHVAIGEVIMAKRALVQWGPSNYPKLTDLGRAVWRRRGERA